jgi:hypothetical protein
VDSYTQHLNVHLEFVVRKCSSSSVDTIPYDTPLIWPQARIKTLVSTQPQHSTVHTLLANISSFSRCSSSGLYTWPFSMQMLTFIFCEQLLQDLGRPRSHRRAQERHSNTRHIKVGRPIPQYQTRRHSSCRGPEIPASGQSGSCDATELEAQSEAHVWNRS